MMKQEKQEQKWTMLSFKSAFLFFLMVIVINVIFQPVFRLFGVSDQVSLFIINSVGISIALSYALLVLNKMYRNKKQAIIISGLIAIVSFLVCYTVIFLGW